MDPDRPGRANARAVLRELAAPNCSEDGEMHTAAASQPSSPGVFRETPSFSTMKGKLEFHAFLKVAILVICPSVLHSNLNSPLVPSQKLAINLRSVVRP